MNNEQNSCKMLPCAQVESLVRERTVYLWEALQCAQKLISEFNSYSTGCSCLAEEDVAQLFGEYTEALEAAESAHGRPMIAKTSTVECTHVDCAEQCKLALHPSTSWDYAVREALTEFGIRMCHDEHGWFWVKENVLQDDTYTPQSINSELSAKAYRESPAVAKGREWWLACDGFDRHYTAYDSYEDAKKGRTMTPIHVGEVARPATSGGKNG